MNAKKILVLGSTGGTGRALVAQALERGHSVTVVVREPSKLPVKSDRLHVIVGDAAGEGATLLEAARGQDAVISALGAGKSFKPDDLILRSMRNLVRAMESAGSRRLILTSGFGVGDTFRDAPLVPRIFIRTLLKNIYRDKLAGEAIVRASSLDWTIVYPTGLTDGPAKGTCRAGERLRLRGFPTIARADVADFLLRQLDDTAYLKKGVLISS